MSTCGTKISVININNVYGTVVMYEILALIVFTLMFFVGVAMGVLPIISLLGVGVMWFGILLAYVGLPRKRGVR